MNLEAIFKKATKVVSDNSSVILTGTAVAGTVTTAIFSAKGHASAVAFELEQEYLRYREGDTHPYESPKGVEWVKEHYRHYVPAAISGTMTVACVVGIHSVNTRRQAALVSAYTVMDKAFADYKQQVVETVGAKQETAIRDEVAKKTVTDNPPSDNPIFVTNRGESLCHDSWSGRYFQCDIETIRKAQNDINQNIFHHMYASQNDFYNKIGLSASSLGEEFGWNTDRMLDISFSSHLTDDGKPCLVLNYTMSPIRNYWKA